MAALTTSEGALDRFLKKAGWADAERRPLAGDASTRSYQRLRRDKGSAVLMIAPPAAEAPACPPDADAEARAKLGYNAMARLAGPNPAAFAGLARELVARGWSAPRILAADLDAGLVLLEDLGDDLYARVIERGAKPRPLYEAAIDMLAAVRRATVPAVLEAYGKTWPILDYDPVALQAEADLFIDWYAKEHAGVDVGAEAKADWHAAWAEAFEHLKKEPAALVLRDVHAENLIWLPDREGPAQAGVIDFQDALFGHPAYDLVSLLEDARRDVEPALAEAMIERYLANAYIDDVGGFLTAYAVLGAQRNAKILGIFVRLATRDHKQKYLEYLPRVARNFLEDLTHPALEGVRAWVVREVPQVFEEADR